MSTKHLIKRTWFRKDTKGKNVVVQNTITDCCFDNFVLDKIFKYEISYCLDVRKLKPHKLTDNSATFFVGCGFMNIRKV